MAKFGRSILVVLLWTLATNAALTHAQALPEADSLENSSDHWLVARNATPDFSAAARALFSPALIPKDSCFNNRLLISDASLHADDSPANVPAAKSGSCEDKGKSPRPQFTLLPVNPCGSFLVMDS